jgi:hypothetical protein
MYKTTGNVERKNYLEFTGTNGRKIIVNIQFGPPEDEHSIARNMSRYLM